MPPLGEQPDGPLGNARVQRVNAVIREESSLRGVPCVDAYESTPLSEPPLGAREQPYVAYLVGL